VCSLEIYYGFGVLFLKKKETVPVFRHNFSRVTAVFIDAFACKV
jgi:hypothetical protein